MRGERPSVWFTPYYFYLHDGIFQRVAQALRSRGAVPRLFELRGASGMDESSSFGPTTASGRRWDREVVAIRRSRRTGLVGAALRIARFLDNRRRIARAIGRGRPEVLVVGSDLGGVYVRAALDAAAAHGVTRLIVLATTVGWDAPRSELPWPGLVTPALRLLGAHRNLTFRGGTPGMYDTGATIAVPGADFQSRLIRQGIAADRIVLTGNPLEDECCALGSGPEAPVRARVTAALGVPSRTRVVTCLTEVLQDVYGWEYLDTFYAIFRRVVDELPDDVLGVLKIHPKEPDPIAEDLAVRFPPPRYRVIRQEIVTRELMRVSFAVCGHLSGALLEALMMRAHPVVIRFPHDSTRRLVPEAFCALEVHHEEALRAQLQALQAGVPPHLARAADGWREAHSAAPDGDAVDRVADLILRLADRATSTGVGGSVPR